QGQVVRFLDNREKNQDLVLIKDIEQELNITKSVASNLVKRMVQNGLVELEASPVDKRAKFVRLTDKSRSQMKQVKAFFERIDKQLIEGIDEDELLIFEKVLAQLQENIKGIGGENEEIRQTN
ncbi:MAG: MarR family winged helix-turn-helix transcriptional regulator, partial [Streptococcus mitis]|nr:MarR family winged helix-turn-helix transcriptional regulator [Streptococcus mitis]